MEAGPLTRLEIEQNHFTQTMKAQDAFLPQSPVITDFRHPVLKRPCWTISGMSLSNLLITPEQFEANSRLMWPNMNVDLIVLEKENKYWSRMNRVAAEGFTCKDNAKRLVKDHTWVGPFSTREEAIATFVN